jgi:hypothetical protein
MNLVLTMSLDNAAFRDGGGKRDGVEIARILHRLADTIQGMGVSGGEVGQLRDLNGNAVGAWRITPLRDGGDE